MMIVYYSHYKFSLKYCIHENISLFVRLVYNTVLVHKIILVLYVCACMHACTLYTEQCPYFPIHRLSI